MKRLLVAVIGLGLSLHLAAADSVDSAFTAFWKADNPGAAEKAARQVAQSGADFDAIYARLRAGRPYTTQPTGIRQLPSVVNGDRLDSVADVPAEYTPDKKWALRVELHGGVGRPAPGPGDPAPRSLTDERIPGESQIYLHPRAFSNSEWWRVDQLDNVFRMIDSLKRAYNVDESRIYVTGISDGGTGVYYFAMRQATAFAACLPLNGHPLVLSNRSVGAEGELFMTNVANCPMYLVNGGKDPLYPASSVEPFVYMMKEAGASVEFHVHPDAGHNTSWWPEERPLYEQFLAGHHRQAQPAKLSWETERTDRFNRIHWLVIDKLGKRPSDAELKDVNTFLFRGRDEPLYERNKPSGRVDVARQGNAFDAKTRGVAGFTLLLSPDVVDFGKPVTVTVNGKRAFEGTVKKDAATLLKWAARDNDRTMLYGAELAIAVP